MTSVLLVIHVLTAVSIIVLVLMQQGRGADMGAAFGGGSQTLFGARGSANFLSRVTGLLAAVFFVTSLTLAYLYSQSSQPQSVTDQIAGQPVQSQRQNQGQNQSQDQDEDQNQDQDDMPQVPGADEAQEPASDVPAAPEPAKE
jgi:preprotein translocase subunit SecG